MSEGSQLPPDLVERLCVAGAKGDYGIYMTNHIWHICWRNAAGRRLDTAVGLTRKAAAAAMATAIRTQKHSVEAFRREVERMAEPTGTCYGVYYTHMAQWRLVGQYRSHEMADELLAHLREDAARDNLTRIQIRRFDLQVEFGTAPHTLPRDDLAR